MGPCLLASRAKNPKTMQGKVVGMVGSGNPQDRVVERRGRETASFGEAYAHAMEDNCADCWKDGYTVLGEIPEATGRS